MERETAWQALQRAPWRFLSSWWPWRSLLYLASSTLIGLLLLPLFALTLLFVPLWGIVLAAVERRRIRLVGFDRERSAHARVGAGQRHNWLGIRITEAATWREALALVVDLIVGLIVLGVFVFQAATLVVIGYIVGTGTRGSSPVHLTGDVGFTVGPGSWWLVVPIGLLALGLFGYLNTILAAGQATLLRMLLTPRQAELARNVERLTRSRAALVEAFETERRRIERDLHDGVQQELVTLAARLGLVSLELDDLAAAGANTVPAREALEAAQGQAEHAMATLRNTVRGIHPAVLTDHGLRPALNELADRTPVPLVLRLHEFGRLPAPVETAAYYFVTEAVSNAAKHTTATRLTVRTMTQNGALAVTIADNGHGGADENAGTGLRGLRERAETLGGRFSVLSPPGGPTTLHMVLPIVAEGAAHDAPAPR